MILQAPQKSTKTLVGAGAAIVTLLLLLAILTRGATVSTGEDKDYDRDGARIKPSRGTSNGFLHDIQNETLGFQTLLVINDPLRTDRRDTMSLLGSSTGIRFTYIESVKADLVPDEAMPPGAAHFRGGARGAWRAHMNALRLVVEQNLTTAVIFEDDVDWDVRIKAQLHDYALTSCALLQPLSGPLGRTYADPTYPDVLDPHRQPRAMDFASLPLTAVPTQTPYGDNWDILWLGHCGMIRPVADDPSLRGSNPVHISKGLVTHHSDSTVPSKANLHVWDDGARPGLRRDFPDHTRLTHHAQDGVCTFAYAVTQAGARRILYELGVWKMDDGFDMMLRMFCDGVWGHERHICLTVRPSFFSHYTERRFSKERVAGKSEDPEHPREHLGTETFNIRWSARYNLQKLVDGQTDLEDQWPDGWDEEG